MEEEEMIKNIKDVIYTDTGERMNYIDIDNLTSDNECDTFIKAIEEILDSYNNLKQIEQEHQKINGELREEIKQLKDEFYKEKCLNKLEKPQCKHMSDKPYLE